MVLSGLNSNSFKIICMFLLPINLKWIGSIATEKRDDNFDDDSIKNEQASMEIPFSHYKSMGKFLNAQGQLTP